jgi:hypothetical protein
LIKLVVFQVGGGAHLHVVSNLTQTSQASFQVNGLGGVKLVRAKKLYQFGIIPVDQGVYFLNAEFFQISFHSTPAGMP